jgi:signal transduction histidine kinase
MLIKRVQRMYHLIDSILEYSNIIRIKEKEQEVDLNALLAEVIHEIEAPENVQISIDNNLPAVVCDKELMMRVFENLLSNAVKHAGKPRGQIKVNCEQENNFWRFSVIDNGLGIEEKYFKKIFQMFQTLSTQEGFESSGVGLSVVKKIVELYGGKIWVESKGGQGSTFSFTLPKHKERVKDEKLQSSTVG